VSRLIDFLRACADAERAAGEFYRFLSETFATHPEAAAAFGTLAEEEEGHARTFEFLRSLVRDGDQEALLKPSFGENLERLRRGLEKAKEDLRAKPSLADAVGMALLLEETTLERDKAAFAEIADREIQRLIKSVITADDGHRRDLIRLREALTQAA